MEPCYTNERKLAAPPEPDTSSETETDGRSRGLGIGSEGMWVQYKEGCYLLLFCSLPLEFTDLSINISPKSTLKESIRSVL